MNSVTNDGILFNKLTATIPTLSKVVKLGSDKCSILAQINGTGALTGTLNVYGGLYSETTGTWIVKVLDATYPLTGTGQANLKKNVSLKSHHVQLEITGLTGTGAALTAAIVNTA